MKATVKYNSLFITSAYDIKTLEKVAKFRPDALDLYKGEGKEKEVVCSIAVSKKASANDLGITFAKNSATAPYVATMSIDLPDDANTTEKINAFVRDKLGLAIVNCLKIEEQIATALTEIASDEAAMDAVITIENEPEHTADAE